MDIISSDWDHALALLGEVLTSRRATPCHLIVCGGAALIASGTVSRVTRDVDVLAARGEVDGEISQAWPMPQFLKEADAEACQCAVRWLRQSGIDASSEHRLHQILTTLGHGQH